MTTPEERENTLQVAERLTDSLVELRGDIRRLDEFGTRNRRMIQGIVISLALNAVLLVLVAAVAIQASNATSVANQNKQTAVTTCNASNQARSVSTQLWTYMLSAAEKSNRDRGTLTPQVQDQINNFRQYIATAYAPRDCTREGA
jgi:hypothetical protein